MRSKSVSFAAALTLAVALESTASLAQTTTHEAAPATSAVQRGDAGRPVEVGTAVKTAAGAAKPEAAKKEAAPAKPELTGLERLSDDWPKWLKVGVVYRGRVESARSPIAPSADYDGYYLNRLRLNASVRTSQWLQTTVQVQDTQALGYAAAPAPRSAANPLDLRMAYVDIGKKATRGVTASVGRQELSLGDSRLIASPDWGNSSRTYDLARVTGTMPGVKLDLFGGAPIDLAPTGFHRAKVGERFYGAFATFDKIKRVTTLDLYFVGRANRSATGELGAKGDARLYTTAARLGARIAGDFSLDAGGALQRGHAAADAVSAWGAHASVTWASAKARVKPRVTAEYVFASGDRNPKDGVRGTFDQLYSSNHAKYGLADHIGWRNTRIAAVKFEASPTKKLKVNSAFSHLQLATLNDAWYGSSGSKVVLNRKATSRTLGYEADLYAAYTVSKELSIGAGLAGLFSGGFLEQSTGVTRIWSPYVMWTTKF